MPLSAFVSVMNVRRDRANLLSTGPINYASINSHHETPLATFQNNQVIVYLCLALLSAYLLFDHFGLAPISLISIAWNILVFATPSWIIVALDTHRSPSESSPSGYSAMSFQSKSDAMQRILGLDSNTFPAIRRSRSLSGIGNALLGHNQDAIPPGLGNWDNSCYQNSTIQGLASLKSLASFLERNIESLSDKESIPNHQALRGIIDHLNSASNSGHKLWIPAELKSMSSWQQQDAQEYFSKLVDQIDMEVKSASQGQTDNMGLKQVGLEEHILNDIRENNLAADGTTIEKSSLRNPLEGLLAQRVGCIKCGWTEGLSLIPFNCLTVPLGPRQEYNLGECFDQYMALEPIEGVECAKCTLLRAQEQVKNLLDSLTDKESSSENPTTPGLSDSLRTSAQARLEAVETAIEENDFAEKTLTDKCHIPAKNRVTSTKSRQAVIARAPQCLVVHINRSVFDETTFMQKKNYASVKFSQKIDLNDWCLGTQADRSNDTIEEWVTNPSDSMLPVPGKAVGHPSRMYELRAIVTHYGRHENGHYICYRKYPTAVFPATAPDEVLQAEGDKDKPERWYRLSDDDVQMVSEGHVMSQGGVFMLYYEAIEEQLPAGPEVLMPEIIPDKAESISNLTMSENMSVTTTTDADSDISHATSLSSPDFLPSEAVKTYIPPLRASSGIGINPQRSTDDLDTPSMVTA